MKTTRDAIFEIAVFAGILAGVLFFGAVHAWAWGAVVMLLLFPLTLNPSLFYGVAKLPNLFKISWILIAGVVTLQMLGVSTDPQATFQEFLKWLGAASLFVTVQNFSKKALRRSLIFFSGIVLAEAVYALFELLSGHEHVLWRAKEAYQGFATGTFLNRNHLAGFLEMGLGVQLGFMGASSVKKKYAQTIFFAMASGIILLALYKTGSRMGLTSFFTAAVLGGFFLDRKLLFILIPAVLVGALQWETIAYRFMDWETWESSGAGRLGAWKATLEMAAAYPWLGAGLGTFETVFPAFQPAMSFQGYPHAHQDYLELLAVLGIPAFLLLAAGFLQIGSHIIRSIGTLPQEDRGLGAGVSVGLLAFLIHGLADFNFAIPANQFSFFFLFAAVWHLLQTEGRHV